MEYQKFGQRLKELRTAKKIKQKELDAILCFAPNTIKSYENFKSEPNLSDLVTIAHSLDTTTDYLLGTTDNFAYAHALAMCDNYIQILQILDAMPDECVGEVLHYTKFRLKLYREWERKARKKRKLGLDPGSPVCSLVPITKVEG